MENKPITFQFISEPSDVNYGGNVHGGVVMKWIDQAGYACASSWSSSYCVTVYVGGIRFYKSIRIGDVVKVEARVIYTGSTSMHISIDVYARDVRETEFEKKTHCIIVFVAVNDERKPVVVPKWNPTSELDMKMEEYAIRLKDIRATIEEEMSPYLSE